MCVPLSILFAALAWTLRIYATSISILVLMVIFLFYAMLLYQEPFNTAIITGLLSMGLSYFLFFIAMILNSPIAMLIGPDFKYSKIFSAVYLILTGLLQHLLLFLLFRIRRLKNGMPFLKESGSRDTGLFICFTLLFAVVILSSDMGASDMYATLLLVFIVCSGLAMFFWWKKRLYENYLKQLHINELDALKKTIQKQQEEINVLKTHNEKLSRIIHKDNKLLPAMQMAVMRVLKDGATCSGDSATLLTNLNELYQSRNNALTQYEQANVQLPKTNIMAIDAVIQYLFIRATKLGFTFHVLLSCPTNEWPISETELCTLLADLGENAIIATQAQPQRNLLIEFSCAEELPTISVSDSGIAFERDTINKLGISQVTTHADTGGSGIGLVTAFELCKKYQSSFIVEEYADSQLYSKKVSVCFDGQGQFRLFCNGKVIHKREIC